MKKISKHIIIWTIIIMNICNLKISGESDETPQSLHVLVVFSDSYFRPLNEKRLVALDDAFGEINYNDIAHIEVHYDLEFIETRYISNEENYNAYLKLLKSKWSEHIPYDCIIVYDQAGLNVINDLFSEHSIPIIFCGMYNRDFAKAEDQDSLTTGFYDEIDVLGTVALAKQICDSTKDIYVLTDNSDMSAYYYNEISNALSSDYVIHEINFSILALSEYFKELELINKEDTILLVSARTDNAGMNYDYYNSLGMIDYHTKATIYGFWDIGIGFGIIGGSVIDLEAEAAYIVNLVSQVAVSNQDIDRYSVKSNDNYIAVIDYNQLDVYQIRDNKLPDQLKFINEPSIYTDKATILAIVLLVSVVVMLFIGIMGMFYRITSEKKKAISAVKSKSDFLAKMSHEIRTPANAIIGYIDLLKQSINDPEDLLRKAEMIRNSSTTLLTIINDILDYSMIEEGKLIIKPKKIEFLSLFANISGIAEALIGDKNIQFILDIDRDIPEFIEIDENRIIQVFTNLLSNAVKFTEQGNITLQVQKLHLSSRELKLKWEMIDTGVGMDEKNINMIFNAFQQEDNSISRRYGGTGLGLYITKEIVNAMDGHIYVESKVGEGTRFVITTLHYFANKSSIPQRSDELAIMDNTNHEFINPMHQKKHILVAEDNEVNQMLIGEMLHTMKLNMTIVRNGLEAVAYTKNNQYDLILMDIHMPIMDGVEATDKIREFVQYNRVPIIGLTADVIKEHMEEYRKHGFTDILTKPIYMEELIRAFNKYL